MKKSKQSKSPSSRKKSPSRKSDPHAKREAAKYSHPIPSREYILQQLELSGSPLSHEQLCQLLELEDFDDQEALRRRLIAMERDGQVMRDRRKAYGPVHKMHLLRGRVQGHKDGYGFFIPQQGGEDLYLSYKQMQKVFDGDEVLVRPSGVGFKGKQEAVIVEILARNTERVVGRFFRENGIQFVRPDNVRLSHDILIAPGEQGEAKAGQFVTVEIIQQPDKKLIPAGKIIEVLGDHMAPGMEIDVAIRSHGIPHVWPADVLQEAKSYSAEVEAKDKENRIDLRELPFVTIDGEDARDFDDAVYCEKKRGGWNLWVAIADVSHYVAPGSALDREAQSRGTSVYFPDYVVPMLPEALSNGLCSLNPEVDRLCMVCQMSINSVGKVTEFEFFESVIYSQARLTYTQVGEMIDQRQKRSSGVRKKFQHVVKHIDELHNLFLIFRQAREARGAIDFDTVETRIIFDEQRKIKQIVPVVRNDAHKLIEECMLAANVCAAEFLDEHKLVGLYRVHEGPKEEKLENLREFLGELGLYLPGGKKPEPKHYQELLEQISSRSDAHLIQTVMLRSLRQAVYQPQNEGHFGMNYEAYAHFTSPIRRYPDLLVHRAIRHVIRSRKQSERVRRVKGAKTIAKQTIYPYDMQAMLQLGEHCSLTERRADDATRDVASWLKCEFLQDHVGDQYAGVVTGVTGFGLFVELQDLYVEGLVHITSLPRDYYHFEAAHHRLVGENTRRVFRLGDELVVQVARVDLDDRKVDFELIEGKGSKTKRLSKKEADRIASNREKPARGKKKSASKKVKTKKSSAKKNRRGR